MGTPCNSGAFCWSTDVNARHYTLFNGAIYVQEDGYVEQSGSSVANWHDFRDTLTLKLRRQHWILAGTFGLSPDTTITALGPRPYLSIATLAWEPSICGWVGTLTDPTGSDSPAMIVEMYPMKPDGTQGLYGKIYGENWSDDQWLRISSTGKQTDYYSGQELYFWEMQKRTYKVSGSGSSWSCGGWWDDVPSDEIPAWLRSMPSEYVLDEPEIGDGGCSACGGNYSGPLGHSGELSLSPDPDAVGTANQCWQESVDSWVMASQYRYGGYTAPPSNNVTVDFTGCSGNKGARSLGLSVSRGIVTEQYQAGSGFAARLVMWSWSQSAFGIDLNPDATWNPWGVSTLPCLPETASIQLPDCINDGEVGDLIVTAGEIISDATINAGGW